MAMATSYGNGMKYVDEHVYKPLVLKKHLSRSNPNRDPYHTVLWEDGLTSCNCQGWATHKHCRHTLELEQEALSGALGPAILAIRRLAVTLGRDERLERLATGAARARRALRGSRATANYVIDPDMAPRGVTPSTIDEQPVVYRRIKL